MRACPFPTNYLIISSCLAEPGLPSPWSGKAFFFLAVFYYNAGVPTFFRPGPPSSPLATSLFSLPPRNLQGQPELHVPFETKQQVYYFSITTVTQLSSFK